MKYGLSSNLVRFIVAGSGVWLATLAPAMAVTFFPPDDNTAPTYGAGGASRSSLRFIPPPDHSAPNRAAGGASRIGFIPPPDNSAPDRAAGGASREGDADALFFSNVENGADNEFGPNHAAMLAVTPSNLYGLTVSARPTIMAYLPETKAHTAIFSLKDETQSVVYRQVISLNGADGILKITLREDAPALAVDKYYQWFVTLQTGDYITPASPYVTAWIKRVEAASVPTADLPPSLAQAQALAQAGIWYDAAEQMAELQTNPQTQVETAANWTEFLTSVGLNVLLEHSFL